MAEQIEWHPLPVEDRIVLHHTWKVGEGEWRSSPDRVLGWAVGRGEHNGVVYAMASGRVIRAAGVLTSAYEGHARDLDEWWAWRD